MLQYDLQRAADKLINEMFQLKEGENVVISADTSSSMEVVDAVASSARAAGGRVMVVTFPTPGGVGQAADPDIPVDAFTAAVKVADVWIELNHQWLIYSTPYTIAEKENKKLRYLCMDDFTPDKVAAKVEGLKQLLQAREQLSNLLSYMDGKSGAEDLIAKLLADPTLLQALAAQKKPDDQANAAPATEAASN